MNALPPGFKVVSQPNSANTRGKSLPPGFKVVSTPARDWSKLTPSTNLEDPNGKPIYFDGAVNNATAGANSLLYKAAGYPVDAARNVINWGVAGANALQGKPLTEGMIADDNIGGSRWIAEQFAKVGVHDPDHTIANSVADRLARLGGEGVAAAMMPDAIMGVLSNAGVVGPKAHALVGEIIGEGGSVGNVAKNALIGGGSAVSGGVAAEAVPDQFKPLAQTVGGLGGGLVLATAAEAPRVVKAGVDLAADYLAPITEAGRERYVGTQLRNGATNTSAVLDALHRRAELVPGSEPTTFQQTGDMGLGAIERAAATKDPVAFNQRRAEQNAAQTQALENLAPGGSPEQVVAGVRSYLADIDQQLTGTLDAATADAQGRTAALGQGRAPELAGADLRGSYEAARADTKTRERTLWQVVDPSGTMTLPIASTSAGAAQIAHSIPATAKPQSPEESAIFAAASRLGDTARLSDVTALQSRIKAEMRAERFANGESPAYARLVQLNGAVQRDLEGAVAQKVAQEQRAVAAGQMGAEDTMAARFQRVVDQWKAERSQVGQVARQTVGGGDGGQATASRNRIVPSGDRGESPPGGRFGNAPGDQGLSQDGGQPFDAAARGRLSSAIDATRERVNTFDNKTLAPMRRRPSTTAPYDMPDSAVAQRLFFAGPKSYDAIQTYRRAVGDGEAMQVLGDYVVDRLRRAALRDDGTLDPARVAAFRRAHSDALRAFPQLDAQISDAAQASAAALEQAQARSDVLDAAQAGVVGRLLGVEHPQDVTRAIGSIFGRQDAVQQMRRLRSVLGKSPEGQEGLRKAIVDHMLGKFVSNSEAATSGLGTLKADGIQTFIGQNKAALAAAGFSDDELRSMEALAEDIQRSTRSLTAVKIPGQSNTAQDTLAAKPTDTKTATILKVAIAVAANGGSWLAGPVPGSMAALGTAGGVILDVLRQTGLKKAETLLRDALLNPSLARRLMVVATPRTAKAVAQRFAQTYRRVVLIGSQVSNSPDQPHHAPARPVPARSLGGGPLPTPRPAPMVSAMPDMAGRSAVENALIRRQSAQAAMVPPGASAVMHAIRQRYGIDRSAA